MRSYRVSLPERRGVAAELALAVARANESSAWERVNEVAVVPEKPAPKAPPKNGANPNFGMNMPMMSSAFDTAMWLNAA